MAKRTDKRPFKVSDLLDSEDTKPSLQVCQSQNTWSSAWGLAQAIQLRFQIECLLMPVERVLMFQNRQNTSLWEDSQ